MKVIIDNEKNILLYLPAFQMDFHAMDQVEKELRNIFLRLKYYYFIDIQGFYEVKVYKDRHYGLILELKKDLLEYFDYYEDEIEMRIELIEVDFVYEVKDILELPKEIREKSELYLVKNKYYVQVKEEIEMEKLLENVLGFHYKNNPFLLKEKNRIYY